MQQTICAQQSMSAAHVTSLLGRMPRGGGEEREGVRERRRRKRRERERGMRCVVGVGVNEDDKIDM